MSLDFRALNLVNKERSAYGLRYNDYTRYRLHCANKVHRLRRALHATHGKGREFKTLPDVSLAAVKVSHLQLWLFEAERLYAFAQELFEAKQHHKAIAKQRRSLHWAEKLVSFCLQLGDRLSVVGLSEVLVYANILQGKLYLKRDDFSSALSHLCVSHNLLQLLRESSALSRDQALADVYMDEIHPEIRYSAHELKHSRSKDISKIIQEIASQQSATLIDGYSKLTAELSATRGTPGHSRLDQQLKPWKWDGTDINIRNPELVDALLKVQYAEAKAGFDSTTSEKVSSKSRMAGFDAVLQVWTEAEDVARKLMETRSQNTSDTTRDAVFIHSFIMFQLLCRRTSRDRLLISGLTFEATSKKEQPNRAPIGDARHAASIIKMLDTVLQSLNQMRTLGIVEESPELTSQIEACLAYTKAERVFHLSSTYATETVKQYGPALALLQRCRLHLREARSCLSLATTTNLPNNAFSPSIADVSHLETRIEERENHLKHEWFSYNGGKVAVPQKEVVHRKEAAHKPLFFDIALNYAELNLEKLQSRAGIATAPSSAPAITPKPEISAGSDKKIPAGSAEAEIKQPASRLGSILGSIWGR